MAITASDIKFRFSGGSANTTASACLGGFMSLGASIADNTANNMWDNITGAQASQGDTNYRCFFIRMSHATLNWTGINNWVSQTTTSGDDKIYFGFDTMPSVKVGKSYWVQSVADETTAPANVSFVNSSTKATGVSWVGAQLEPISAVAIWAKRVVTAGANAVTSNYWGFKIEGDSAA